MYAVQDCLALGACSLFPKNFLLVRLREPVFSFCLEWHIIVCAVWDCSAPGAILFGATHLLCLRSRPAWLQEPVLVIYAVRDHFALGAGFLYLLKIIVIQPCRPFWIWHMLTLGSFGSGLGQKFMTYKCLKTLIYISYFASPLGGRSN